MKKLVVGLVALSSGVMLPAQPTSAAASAPSAKAAVAPPAGNPSVQVELDQLVARVNAKLKSGAVTAKMLAADMKEFDEILARHQGKGEPVEAVAQVLYIKAMFQIQVLKNYDEGVRSFEQIKRDFPTSPQAQTVDESMPELKFRQAQQQLKKTLSPGQPFPDFSEKDLNGQPLSVGKFKGHPVLLQFWSPTSPAYLQELPGQMALYQKFHPKGFEIIGVAVDDHEFTVKKFLKETGMPWPQYFDGKVWDNKLAERYGVGGVPASFLIGADGKIVGIDLRSLAVDELLTKMLPK